MDDLWVGYTLHEDVRVCLETRKEKAKHRYLAPPKHIPVEARQGRTLVLPFRFQPATLLPAAPAPIAAATSTTSFQGKKSKSPLALPAVGITLDLPMLGDRRTWAAPIPIAAPAPAPAAAPATAPIAAPAGPRPPLPTPTAGVSFQLPLYGKKRDRDNASDEMEGPSRKVSKTGVEEKAEENAEEKSEQTEKPKPAPLTFATAVSEEPMPFLSTALATKGGFMDVKAEKEKPKELEKPKPAPLTFAAAASEGPMPFLSAALAAKGGYMDGKAEKEKPEELEKPKPAPLTFAAAASEGPMPFLSAALAAKGGYMDGKAAKKE